MRNAPPALSRDQLEKDGFQIVSPFLDEKTVHELRLESDRLALENGNVRGGIRGLLSQSPRIDALSKSRSVDELLHHVGGDENYIAYRGILFDKKPGANWKVAWHQDLTITVDTKSDLIDYGPWTEKDGVVHVQPPTAVLEQIITFRLHLDNTPYENGALRVIPGSHHQGKLSSHHASKLGQKSAMVVTEVPAGGVMMMKPLLLHASSPSKQPGHRRIIHLEFGPANALPPPLKWERH